MVADPRARPAAEPRPSPSSFVRQASSAPPRLDPVLESRELKPGAVIGDFELVKRIGVGGMGAVWEARQRSLQRRVALKLIRPEQIDAHTIELFEREARAGGKLNHPGIVGVHAAGESDGTHYIAQELIEGGHDLGSAIAALREGEAIPSDYYREVAGFAAQLADALQAAHDAGVIHRDIKPQNVLIDAEGRPKISDFGLARLVEEQSLTGRYGMLGSVFYMSPEQAAAKSIGVDHRADVFSLGVVLYEMLTLRRPFEGDTEQQVLERILHEDPPSPARVRSRVPQDLAVICLKAIEKRRDQRYATMRDLAEDLRRFVAHEPILARPAGWARRAQKWTLRHPTASACIGLGVVSMVVISWLLMQTLRAKEEAEQRASEVLRLSGVKRLRDLEARAERLWPALPSNAAALEAWLADADALASDLPQHRASLERLRAQAAGSGADGEPAFADDEQAWWHETLRDLVASLARFLDPDPWVGTRANVARRLESARTIRRRTIDDFAREWDEARFFLAESATYGRIDLAPQTGLVPIGPDPDSGLWEFWHVESGVRPERDEENGRLRPAADGGLVLVLLPGGAFRMGAQRIDPARPNHDPGAQLDETVHEVTLAPFFLSKFEMTQAQWRALTHENPSFFGPGRVAAEEAPLCPVEQVTWEECQAVLARGGLALPTEAQWEYAARGGTTTPWWTGADPQELRTAANLADASYLRGNRDAFAAEPWDDGCSAPAPVGSFAANPFGLHDVVGNVWEWCADGYAPYERTVREGDGLRSPLNAAALQERVYRGGGFATRAAAARSAFRVRFLADSRDNDLGVRPARPIDRE